MRKMHLMIRWSYRLIRNSIINSDTLQILLILCEMRRYIVNQKRNGKVNRISSEQAVVIDVNFVATW